MFWRLILLVGNAGFKVFKDYVFILPYACAQNFLLYCQRLRRKSRDVGAQASSSSSGIFSTEISTPTSMVSAPSTSASCVSRSITLPLSTVRKLADIIDQHGSTISRSSSAEFETDPKEMQEICDMLLQSCDYEKALEQLEVLRKVQSESIDTLIMIVECQIFLDNFQEAERTFQEATSLAILSKDVKRLVEKSQHYRQSDMSLRSLNYIWCACSVYQNCGSPEGMLECLRNMGELLVQVADKYGTRESPNCERFANFHVHQLLSLGELKDLCKPDNSALFVAIRLHRYAAIASCFLLLKKYNQSQSYFGECIGLASESTEPSKINFSIVGNFVAGAALSYNQTDEKLRNIAERIDETRKNITKFAEAFEKDAALKANMFWHLEYCATDVQNCQRRSRAMISTLVQMFLRR